MSNPISSIPTTVSSMILLLLCLPHAVFSARLLLMSASVNSHVNYFSRLGLGLAQGGHDVTMIIPGVSRVPDWLKHERVEIISYTVPGTEPYTSSARASEMMVKQALAPGLRERIAVMGVFGEEVVAAWDGECHDLLTNTELRKKLAARKFQHSIIDAAGFGCQVALPYALDVPMSVYSIFSSPWGFRVPALPSFYPGMLTEFSDVMTFSERVQNVLAETALFFMHNHTDIAANIRRYVPEKEPKDRFEFLDEFKLWFIINDIATGYPGPVMPNMVPIGDVLAVPAKPLPEEFTTFLDSATEGVVLVSFGSVVEYLPKYLTQKMCGAFNRIPQKVIWKLDDPELCPNDGKIMMKNWFPQNDLLGHPKVKLFISHVGVSSVVETIYHGVPVISIPIGIDQPFQAAFMTSRNFGTRLNLRDFTVEELVDNIKLVTENPKYRENIQHASAILKDKPQNASVRASFMMDHVVKYGSEHLKSAAFKLNLLQFYMVDVFLFLVGVIVVAFVLIAVVLCCCYKLCKRCCCTGTQGKKLKVN